MKNYKLPTTELERIIYSDIYFKGIPTGISFSDGNYLIGKELIATVAPSISGRHIIIEMLEVCSKQNFNGEITPAVLSIDIQCRDPFEEIEALYMHLLLHVERHKDPCERHPDLRCSDCHLRTIQEKCFNKGVKP